MSCLTILERFGVLFEQVGIANVISGEPTSLQLLPAIYTVIDGLERTYPGGNVVEIRYRFLHRYCVAWQDNAQAELDLARYAGAIPAILDANRTLQGACKDVQIEGAEAQFVTIDGTEYRCLDFYSTVREFAALGSG